MKDRIATRLTDGVVEGMRFMKGGPYDGHTLAEALEQVGTLIGTDRPPATAIVDKGYRGVEIEGVRILRSRQRRGVTRTLKAMIKRRSIGHMKMDGRLGRNPLKGTLGDALHGVMCAPRFHCARFGLSMQAVIAALIAAQANRRSACG